MIKKCFVERNIYISTTNKENRKLLETHAAEYRKNVLQQTQQTMNAYSNPIGD